MNNDPRADNSHKSSLSNDQDHLGAASLNWIWKGKNQMFSIHATFPKRRSDNSARHKY